jgi:molybdopterin-guanine dinucleotide biosynthesis protein A
MIRHAQITGAPVTISSVNGFAQTFPAVIDRSVLPKLEDEFRNGAGGCFAAFQHIAAELKRALSILPAELLVQAGQVAHPEGLPASLWFLNVNRPVDVSRASRILAAHRRVC